MFHRQAIKHGDWDVILIAEWANLIVNNTQSSPQQPSIHPSHPPVAYSDPSNTPYSPVDYSRPPPRSQQPYGHPHSHAYPGGEGGIHRQYTVGGYENVSGGQGRTGPIAQSGGRRTSDQMDANGLTNGMRNMRMSEDLSSGGSSYDQSQQSYQQHQQQRNPVSIGRNQSQSSLSGSGSQRMRQRTMDGEIPPMPHQPYSNQSQASSYHPPYMQNSGAASVYSLDTGVGAYNAIQTPNLPQNPYSSTDTNRRTSRSSLKSMGGGMTPFQSPSPPSGSMPTGGSHEHNPYMAAASDYMGMPPPPLPPLPQGMQAPPIMSPASGITSSGFYNIPESSASTSSYNLAPMAGNGIGGPSAGPPPSRVVRNVSSASSLSRQPTVIGSSNARRKGAQRAVDVTKPPFTKEFVDDYRQRMKGDPDPEARFAFAKYLIDAARIIGDEMTKRNDAKAGRKYRDALLAETLKVLKKLANGADNGYAEAQFFLANMIGTGQLGLQVEYEKAYQLYMQASKQNHPAATYRTAVCNELGAGTRKEPNRAVLFYRKAATLRDTAAMYKLGMILLGGLLQQPKNPREGVTWLKRAAQQADEDNPHALYELAMLYEDPAILGGPNNPILPRNPELAREAYTQAAQFGYAPAQFKLGTVYEYGTLGCAVDPKRSIAWLSKAAENGDAEAELALSGWFLTGAEGVLNQSDSEAFLWAKKSANKGMAKAEYAVGCEL